MKWSGQIDTGRPADEIESLKGGASWVPSLPQKAPSGHPNPVAYPVIEGIGQHSDGRALEAQPSVVETSTPFWRSVALVIRAIAPALIITGLVMMAALIAGADEQIAAGILIFGAALVAGFWHYTDRAERRDSAAGIEHHRIDEAAALAELREMNQHRLKKALVKDYVRSLKHDSDND